MLLTITILLVAFLLFGFGLHERRISSGSSVSLSIPLIAFGSLAVSTSLAVTANAVISQIGLGTAP